MLPRVGIIIIFIIIIIITWSMKDMTGGMVVLLLKWPQSLLI
jgi:hypothetical protein